MTDTTKPAVPKCPICPRIRRANQPLCNRDMRHAGTETVARYLARVKIAREDPHNRDAQARLAEVVEQLMANARAYQQIRGLGLHPHWNEQAERWENPQRRAEDILTGWLRRHRFSLDASNDRAVVEQIAVDLFPPSDR